MTLKQFKDSIKIGDAILCTEYRDNFTQEVPEKMKKTRYVSYKDTTGFYMKGLEDRSRGSFCGWPKASELTINGDYFTIKDEHLTRTYQRV